MASNQQNDQGTQISRREFLKTSSTVAAGVLASGLPVSSFVHAQGTDRIRVGVIGIGGRGGGAIRQCVNSAPNVELWAIGDYWPGKAVGALEKLQKDLGDKCKVTPERCFAGFDNYKQVIDSGVDLVVMASPPGFRPVQYRYAVEKGKHVFMEKPVATCPAGVRMVIEASKLAQQKGLGVVAGTQRRHQAQFCETVKRIQDGAIGQILAAQCYWNGGRPWNRKPDPALSEIEQQMFNWYHYSWLCGDHICEQHVHNLDVINWCFSTPDALAHPVRCMAVGGLSAHRVLEGPDAQKSTEPGNAWDNFAVEYEYPGGVFVQSYCRHWEPCPGVRSGENLVGTKGTANPSGRIKTETEWRFEGQGRNPYEQEHADLIASIRAGKPLNEGESVAYSTMVAIMGRMAAYTGQNVTWDFAMNQSKLNLLAEDPQAGPHPVDPAAVPGKTKLI